MFYGRESDLNDLAQLWRKRVASLVTCRGRRRIGKSTLIEEFARRSGARLLKIEGKAPEPGLTNRHQLASFLEQLRRQTKTNVSSLGNWSEAFKALDDELGRDKTVLLLDEISWMGKYDVGFPGELKIAWDNLFKKHNQLIVVLCGSVSTWISKNILNNTGFVGRASLNLTVRELPIDVCVRFWGRRAARTATKDIIDVLSVTGGVPRYLEEVDPSLSADENIRRMCFTPNALLRDDFTKIFNVVFGANAVMKRRILECLSNGPLSVSELSEGLGVERSGSISDHLDDLEVAGFVAEDVGIDPSTGRESRRSRYRVSDNYTRFFLRYIQPNARTIDNGSFRFNALETLKGWEAMLGLQFENLIIGNLPALLDKVGFGNALLKSAAPYRQLATNRRKGCQIDLLLQAERKVCVVEIKRKAAIGREVEDEVERKVRALALGKDVSVRTALVYAGELSKAIEADGYFDYLISVESLMTSANNVA